MNEFTINGLVNLFSIFSVVSGKIEESRKRAESFLIFQTGAKTAQAFLDLFDELADYYKTEKLDSDSISTFASQISEKLKSKLNRKEQILTYLRFLELTASEKNDLFEKPLNKIRQDFNIDEELNNELLCFIKSENVETIPHSKNFLIISERCISENYHIARNIKGYALVYYIRSINAVVLRLTGNDFLFIESRVLNSSSFQLLTPGDSICGKNILPVYYSDIIRVFSNISKQNEISFIADAIEYKFPDGTYGLRPFTFKETSGTFIAVMGGSGAGKTTLMNLLNGGTKPSSGSLYINNNDIHIDKEKTEGTIGYVPQDDMLFEDLTVFQNLYYGAKLSFDGLDDTEISIRVEKILNQLELDSIKNLRVGNFLNKFISGGQRKRLNIALELIREPSILLVDEPTSGLSSSDSEKVVLLLKEQANLGKIIIINIHQPSSFIFRMFDSLWILDKGGRIIYKGKPLDAISYFKRNAFYPQPDERECPECGSLNPEIVFKIIEDKKLDGAGEYGSERKNSAEEWQNLYQKNFPDSQKRIIVGKPLPINNASKKPSVFKQLKIFCGRNFRIKTANRQYMFTILLQTPLLALIVAYFTKYVSAQGYNFNSNKHLPFYIFMTAIVSLFSGMTTSAEEIIKDRSVLKREEFLNLSWGSYLNSKIIFLLGASAIQALLYIIIGNSILAIKGQFLLYWLIFFSSSCAANMIGLNLSNALNSAAAIYILIPLILIPQILLGGLIIEFDDMPFKMKTDNNVSFIGNLTTSRWAYEALAVGQFKYNGYQKFFFDVEKNIWDYLYYGDLLIPELKRRLNAAAQNKKPLKEEDIHIIQNEIKELRGKFPSLNLQNQIDNYDKTIQELESARSKIKYLRNVSERKKDKLLNDLQIKFGSKKFDNIRKKFSNDALSNIVKKSGNGEFYRETSERLVRLCAPVYKEPQSEIGGAHFYSAEKKVFDYYLETPFFNAAIIWIQAFVLYLILFYNLPRRLFYN